SVRQSVARGIIEKIYETDLEGHIIFEKEDDYDLFYRIKTLLLSIGLDIDINEGERSIKINIDHVAEKKNVSMLISKHMSNNFKNISDRISEIVDLGYEEEMQCISVDNDDNLYLTNYFIVTHNTYTLSRIIEKIGIYPEEVAFVAFTGMAAGVMTRNGQTATTIHRLIYKPFKDKKTNKINFSLRDELDPNIKLIVIDEISMVGQKLLDDLESFGIPYIGIGDPAQLGPVGTKPNKLLDNPDIFLDTPVRQSLDNPIVYLANEVRQGKSLSTIGKYSDNI